MEFKLTFNAQSQVKTQDQKAKLHHRDRLTLHMNKIRFQVMNVMNSIGHSNSQAKVRKIKASKVLCWHILMKTLPL